MHAEVYSSPVVFRAEVPGAPGESEIVIAALFGAADGSDYHEGEGVLRILRAEDCTQRAVVAVGAQALLVTTVSPAAADLDGDGFSEVVVAGADGSTHAFGVGGNWSTLWAAPLPGGASWAACASTPSSRCPQGWGSFSIHDLDDDGSPEVIREGVVFSSVGALRALAPAGYGDNGPFQAGSFPLVANLDGDPAIELTDGLRVWEWVPAGPLGAWVEDTGFVSDAPGAAHVAAADIFPEPVGIDPQPELALVRNGSVLVLGMDGTLEEGYAFDVAGAGSPPAVADFDGDGWMEIVASHNTTLTLFDPDCDGTPRAGGTCPPPQCVGTCGPGVAWARPIQDAASGRTPPIAFDFDFDGASEAVFADECYVRTFDSAGDVVHSQARASCTFQEGPVVAAIDESGRAALIVPSNTACAVTCPTLDPIFAGERCSSGSECGSGICDEGLCRCVADTECELGSLCAPALPGSPGTGLTCRAARSGPRTGIAVFTDPAWTRTRPVWNQAAYAVTNIADDGAVPRSSEWQRNWLAMTDGHRSNPALGPLPSAIFADGFEAATP